MAIEVIWRSTSLTSSLHAALAATSGQTLVDPRLASLQEPAMQLRSAIDAANLPADRFWGHLLPLSGMGLGRRQLAETAVAKTIGRGPRFDAIIGDVDACIAEIEAAMRTAVPNLTEELALRERPLREQWEARGNGLLREIGRLTEEALIPDRCEVLLVLPAIGGYGQAHLAYNSLRIEAVLANPIAELPEVVRLAWLIAQLQLDVPKYSEGIDGQRLPNLARLAMLPPAILAAETMELTRFTPELIATAVATWRLEEEGTDVASSLHQWWQTYIESRPPFHVALAALDEMLG
jgi:hypothetical protein